jgi:hypothetical protein
MAVEFPPRIRENLESAFTRIGSIAGDPHADPQTKLLAFENLKQHIQERIDALDFVGESNPTEEGESS